MLRIEGYTRGKMALLTITVLLCLPFGESIGSHNNSSISKPLFDLCNDILGDSMFDPEVLHSPLKPLLEPPTEQKEEGVVMEARSLMVDIPFSFAAIDGYMTT